MCRLYGFRSTEATKVECTLVYAQNALLAQSRSDYLGRSHPDGWGIGVYRDGLPLVERHTTAAFEGLHFSTTAERVFASTVVAHVRQATVGGPSAADTHPFVHGPWTFAHNGTVEAFPVVEPILAAETDPALLALRRGVADSELAFYWLLTRMARHGLDPAAPCRDLGALVEVLAAAVRHLAELCDRPDADSEAKLNFLLTDGTVLLVSRWKNSLYWVEREGIHDCEICGIPHVHHTEGTDYRAVVVASEPISEEAWNEVPDGGVITVDAEARSRIWGS